MQTQLLSALQSSSQSTLIFVFIFPFHIIKQPPQLGDDMTWYNFCPQGATLYRLVSNITVVFASSRTRPTTAHRALLMRRSKAEQWILPLAMSFSTGCRLLSKRDLLLGMFYCHNVCRASFQFIFSKLDTSFCSLAR